MSTIEAQLELEKAMIDRGAENYIKAQRNVETKGKGADLDYSRRLMHEYMKPLIDALEGSLTTATGASARGRAKALLRRVDPAKAMFMAMKGMFNAFTLEQPIAGTANAIGRMIEDEIRFKRFQDQFTDYYDTIIKDFKRKGTKDYRYMHRVLTHSANVQNDEWVVWSPAERVDVGMRLLDIIMTNTNLVTKKLLKTKRGQEMLLVPTDEAKEWIDSHEDISRLMHSDRAPCIIQPDDWTGIYDGGYYDPRLRQSTPMIKTQHGGLHKKVLERLSASGNLKLVMDSLNLCQATPWTVNQDVLEIMRTVWANNLSIGMPGSKKIEPGPSPVPKGVVLEDMDEKQKALFDDWKKEASELYTQEKERVSKSFQVSRIIRMANEYSMHNKFWYVWYADFRGRLYTATAGFSPQGPDIAKGLLQFATGKPLGERGLYWLKVHGANRYGYDKVSYADRVQWVDDRHEEFLRAGADPLSYRETWSNASKPYQFLAFLLEYRKLHELVALGHSSNDFVSHLPIGLDGSCNGLQNFSAMLRDDIGGVATNLVPGSVPADIYTEVATVCFGKLRVSTEEWASSWRAFCKQYTENKISRGFAKRPVMTLPYGATRQSCTKYIFKEILDTERKHFEDGNFRAACNLTPMMWESIGEVVVKAREAMDWLQKASGAATKVQIPLIWKLPDGFVVVQDTKVIESEQILTQLAGSFRVRVGTYTSKIDHMKQRHGVAPNFVHSYDAAHLRATVRKATAMGITDISLIHDDYGTHACDTDLLHKAIREAFVEQYEQNDPLQQFKDIQEARGAKLPELPSKGMLNIRDVLDSEYFFG